MLLGQERVVSAERIKGWRGKGITSGGITLQLVDMSGNYMLDAKAGGGER